MVVSLKEARGPLAAVHTISQRFSKAPEAYLFSEALIISMSGKVKGIIMLGTCFQTSGKG